MSRTALGTLCDLPSIISHGPSHFQDKQSQKRAESFPLFRSSALFRGAA
jgi:hypothetical protein